jgi:hypothetical protein
MLRMRIYHNPASDVILSRAKLQRSGLSPRGQAFNLWNNSQIAAERK